MDKVKLRLVPKDDYYEITGIGSEGIFLDPEEPGVSPGLLILDRSRTPVGFTILYCNGGEMDFDTIEDVVSATEGVYTWYRPKMPSVVY